MLWYPAQAGTAEPCQKDLGDGGISPGKDKELFFLPIPYRTTGCDRAVCLLTSAQGLLNLLATSNPKPSDACRAENHQVGVETGETPSFALQSSPHLKGEAGARPQPQQQTSENPHQSTTEQPRLPKSCCWGNALINPAPSYGGGRVPSHHSTETSSEGSPQGCITRVGKLLDWPQTQHQKGQTLLITWDYRPQTLLCRDTSFMFLFAQILLPNGSAPTAFQTHPWGRDLQPPRPYRGNGGSGTPFPTDGRAGSRLPDAFIFCLVHSVQGSAS